MSKIPDDLDIDIPEITDANFAKDEYLRIRIPIRLKNELNKTAHREGITAATLVRKLIEDHIEEMKSVHGA